MHHARIVPQRDPVEAQVCLLEVADAGAGAAHRFHLGAHGVEIGRCQLIEHGGHGGWFHQQADRVVLLHVPGGGGRDRHAAVGFRVQQAVGFEPVQRLAERCPTDLQFVGESGLGHAHSGQVGAIQETFSQHPVGLLDRGSCPQLAHLATP
jgi:hypothetical protein